MPGDGLLVLWLNNQKEEFFMDVVYFSNGVGVVNTTPHELTFLDGDRVVTVPKSGILINARVVDEEKLVNLPNGATVTLTKPRFVADPTSEEALRKLESECPSGTLIIGSLIAAQAYPGRVFGMTPAPGFERVPPAEKRMSVERFSTFG